VHLAISGYGTTGQAADRPGYDFVIQAVGGLMSITGEPDDAGGRPMKVGVAISDIVTGLYAASGILAALVDRAERTTRARASERAAAGQRIDVSLLGSTLPILVNQAQNAFVSGRAPVRRGNAHPNIVPYETFAASDGDLAIAVGSERQWPRFCEALGLPALAANPRFRSNGDRVEHRAELRSILAERLRERTVDAWGAALDDAEVPWGRVADVTAAFASPEASALGMTVEVEHPAFGVLRQVGIPLRFDVTPGSVRSAPPLLGEHTDASRGELGYASSDIDALRVEGVV
jgi:crotonobetainyl-CoA:carnitine CoA-transferase CaiB-like acyl-CoA transferase